MVGLKFNLADDAFGEARNNRVVLFQHFRRGIRGGEDRFRMRRLRHEGGDFLSRMTAVHDSMITRLSLDFAFLHWR